MIKNCYFKNFMLFTLFLKQSSQTSQQSGGCCTMSATSSSCFVFSWAAGTVGGGQVVVGEKEGFQEKVSSQYNSKQNKWWSLVKMLYSMNFSFCLHIIFTTLFVSNPYIAQSVQDHLYEFVRYVIVHFIYLYTLGKYVCNLYHSGVHQYAE